MSLVDQTREVARSFTDEHLAARIAALHEDPIDLGGYVVLRILREEQERRERTRDRLSGNPG